MNICNMKYIYNVYQDVFIGQMNILYEYDLLSNVFFNSVLRHVDVGVVAGILTV